MSSWYKKTYEIWQRDGEAFWEVAAGDIHWDEPWSKVLDDSAAPLYQWFSGGRLNSCYNALDRHIEMGRGDQAALIYDSPLSGTARQYSYFELRDHVARLAGAFRKLGVGKGDRIVIYMPMVPEAVMAMLASARIGAVHSVVFGGFADCELSKRIDDAKPKLIVSASCGIEPGRIVAYKPILDSAIAMAQHKPDHCLILQRPQCEAILHAPRDIEWNNALADAVPADCVAVEASDPLYILYTSGTTGLPKGVVRDNGGHLVALNWSMKQIYGANPGDVYWAASDIGWVVGHSYIVYGPLVRGCTTILYEGKPVGTPDAGAFWRIIDQYKVNILFVAPTALRAIKKEDPEGLLMEGHDISSLNTLFLAGERADPDTIQWAEKHVQVPVIDHWWQTELGWPAAANYAHPNMLVVKHGSAGVQVPGYDIQVLSPENEPLGANQTGTIAIRLPLPPGTLPTLWNNAEGYVASYLTQHPGYYTTGDAGFMDEDGYLYFMSRIDDIINVAGHRLSTGAMEEVVAAHRDVAECAVIGIDDAIKGMVPVAFVVLYGHCIRDAQEVEREIVQAIRETIGPVAALKRVVQVKRLPKTRSGKILRKTMRLISAGENYDVPATIDDPQILIEIEQAMISHQLLNS